MTYRMLRGKPVVLHDGQPVPEAGYCDYIAWKPDYDAYFELTLPLVRGGGLIVFDNMLWGGKVADSTVRDEDTRAVRALNQKIAGDSRVDAVLLPVGDGMTLARVK